MRKNILLKILTIVMFSALLTIISPYSLFTMSNLLAAEFLNHDRILKINPGDTLSEALDQKFQNRKWKIWGKNGVLFKIRKLNPEVTNLDRLLPEQVIVIGDLGDHLDEYSSHTRKLAGTQDNKSHPLEGAQVQSTPINRFGWLSISPTFSYSLLNATDNITGVQASLLSNINPGVSLQWGQHWSKNFESSLNLGLQQITYNQSDASTSLTSASHLLSNFGFFSAYRLTGKDTIESLSLLTRIEFAQRLFIRGTSVTSNALDAVMIPDFKAGISYRLPAFDPFTLSVYALGALYFPTAVTNYSVQTGTGYEAGFTLEEQLSIRTRLFGAFHYAYANQNSSIATQFQKDIGIRFGLNFILESPALFQEGFTQ